MNTENWYFHVLLLNLLEPKINIAYSKINKIDIIFLIDKYDSSKYNLRDIDIFTRYEF